MNTEKTVDEIIQDRKNEKVVRIKDALSKENRTPVSTGLVELDRISEGGFRWGDLIILSGRTGNGKTTVGLNFMKNYIDYNPVLFSYEVQVDYVHDTMVLMGMGMDPNIFTPKKTVSGDIGWINDRILEAIDRYKSRFIVIDNLDFITSEHTNDDSRRNEIDTIINRIKLLAVEKRIMIVLQAHVVKGSDERKALGNSDLADSRKIATESDYVIFVSRAADEDNIAVGNAGALMVTKSRHSGILGRVEYEITSGKLMREK